MCDLVSKKQRNLLFEYNSRTSYIYVIFEYMADSGPLLELTKKTTSLPTKLKAPGESSRAIEVYVLMSVKTCSGIFTSIYNCSTRYVCLASWALCSYQFHPKPSPRDTTRRSKNPPPQDNHCVQKPFPRHRTGSQKPHPRDIKVENFTNVSINSDTIWNEKLCGLKK